MRKPLKPFLGSRLHPVFKVPIFMEKPTYESLFDRFYLKELLEELLKGPYQRKPKNVLFANELRSHVGLITGFTTSKPVLHSRSKRNKAILNGGSKVVSYIFNSVSHHIY